MFWGDDQDAPLYTRALPLPSTAVQKVLVGQETESIPVVPSTSDGDDHMPLAPTAVG